MIDVGLFARPYLAPGGDMDAFLEIASLADRAGLHSIAFGEHLAIAEGTSRYPFGTWGHGLESPWPDPLITMASVAAVTERLRLSTGVLIASLRPGLLMAKEVATLDVISRGRVELGFGTGWQSEEYVGVGLTWSDRQARFDQVVSTCRLAWGDQPFQLSTSEPIGPLRAYPRPVQDRVPIFYGMKASPANARRIAQYGDGWTPVAVGLEDVRRGVDLIRGEFEAAGRNPDSLTVRVALPPLPASNDPAAIAALFEAAPALLDAGATQLVVGFNSRLQSLAQAAELVAAIAESAAPLDVTSYQAPVSQHV